MSNSQKTIFLTSGATFRFEDVTNFVDGKDVISFDYVSVGDGLTKCVAFYKKHVAGHSTCFTTTITPNTPIFIQDPSA